MKNEIEVSRIEQFRSLIHSGIESWIKAGQIIVEMVDAGETVGSIADESGVSPDIVSRFEQIGRKVIHPSVLISTSPGSRALSLCQYSDQERYSKEKVRLLLSSGDTLLVAVDSLTSDQVRQVFCRGHIRTEAEQRAYIESLKAKSSIKSVEGEYEAPPYVVSGAKVSFKKGAIVSRKELAQILARMG